VRFRDTAVICTERLTGSGAAVELIGTDSNPYLATVGLRVEPASLGTGVDFGLEVELGSMPPAFFTAVETTVRSSLLHGNSGWEIPDARVRMTHSGYWPRQSRMHGTFDKAMSSTAGDFRDLTRLLMSRAVSRAGTVLCEPIHRFEVATPAGVLGPVLSLLARAGGVPMHTETHGSDVLISGDVPAEAVHRLTTMLPDVTRGEGLLTSRLHHFRPRH
jgi:ribosomal protection tetracycline resistance protein